MKKCIVLIIMAAILISGCSNKENEMRIDELEAQVSYLKSALAAAEQSVSGDLLLQAVKAVRLLGEKDMADLSEMVHTEKGVRISPYFYTDVETARVLTGEEISTIVNDTKPYMWGYFDGSGEPMEMNFMAYYERFIFDHDYREPQVIGIDKALMTGNMIDNFDEVYPDVSFVEFHFEGFDPKYEGMDWRTLRLGFEKEDGVWHLVCIIHGEWTI